MTSGMKTMIYPVRDLVRAKALYGSLLGVAPSMDEPYYAGFRVGDQEVGLDPNGHSQGLTGPVGYDAPRGGRSAASAQPLKPSSRSSSTT